MHSLAISSWRRNEKLSSTENFFTINHRLQKQMAKSLIENSISLHVHSSGFQRCRCSEFHRFNCGNLLGTICLKTQLSQETRNGISLAVKVWTANSYMYYRRICSGNPGIWKAGRQRGLSEPVAPREHWQPFLTGPS